jgi:hypothetical protein
MSAFWSGISVGFVAGSMCGVITMAIVAMGRDTRPDADDEAQRRALRARMERMTRREGWPS